MRIFYIVLVLGVLTSSCESFLSFLKKGDDVVYTGPSYLPGRKPSAMTGSQFLINTKAMLPEDREKVIYQQVSEGNIPSFLRKPQPLHLSVKVNGRPTRATLWVLPDYLAIGSDADFVRIPMTPITAQRLADHFGWVLPTGRLVDEIYRQAKTKLPPLPLPPGPAMVSNDYYKRHNGMIESQLKGKPRAVITAGHKKDVVLTNRLVSLPQRVAIYGWHRLNGQPIQPLSLVHGNKYADYSHGIRFIQNMMDVDGRKVSLQEALRDDRYASMLSDEGALASARVRTM